MWGFPKISNALYVLSQCQPGNRWLFYRQMNINEWLFFFSFKCLEWSYSKQIIMRGHQILMLALVLEGMDANHLLVINARHTDSCFTFVALSRYVCSFVKSKGRMPAPPPVSRVHLSIYVFCIVMQQSWSL